MADDSNVAEMAVHYAVVQGSMTSIKAYADRGRRFASFSDDCLRAKFVSVIEAWALDLNRRCRLGWLARPTARLCR